MSLCALTLAGCAAQIAYRDGRELVQQGQLNQGLAKLQQAIAADPRNAEYQIAYRQIRDRAVNNTLQQAAQAADAGNAAEASALYQRALVLDPSAERAQAGLRALDAAQRHADLFKEANALADKKDNASAATKLSAILAENPNHANANALRRRLGDSSAPITDGALAAAYRKPISIEFKDVTLKQVFEVIARTSGLNFLFDKDVKTDQKTSIFLKNSTIEAAVYFTLLTNQLEQQTLDANTVLIYPNTAAKQKDYQELVVKTFFLTNADAKSVANTLKTIVKSRDIVVDEKLNLLIVRDSAEAIRLAEKLVALQDIPEPEVMLEVEILEVKRTRLVALGVQWPDSLTLTPLAPGAIGALPTLTPLTSPTGSTLTLRDLGRINSSTLGATLSPFIINANKQDGDANLLANPRIRARNHEKAKILIGDRVPNITSTATSTGFVSESINYVDVGLKLDVEPTVYLDNDVAIKISLEVSNIVNQIRTNSGSVAYQIGTRTASTVLRLKDGENQVLAGLINDEDRSSANKIPGFGDIPVLGRLFGSTSDDKQKTEIVLSITPHLIRNIERPSLRDSEFRAGTDSTLRNRPDGGAPANNSGNPVNPAPLPFTPPSVPNTGIPNGANAGLTSGSGSALVSGLTSTSNPNPVAGSINPAATISGGTPIDPNAPGSVPPIPGSQLRWQGPAQIKAGDTFALQLIMQSDQPVTGLPMTVGYDNKVLQVVGISEGDFLKQGGAQTSFSSRVDPSGQILISANRSGDGGAGSMATVATLNFRAITTSESTRVQLLTIAPVGLAGRPVIAALPAPQVITVTP